MSSNLVKKFFRFVIPSILSMLAFSLYTMVDGMFVAKGVGEKALAAVNLSTPYNSAMFACGLLIAVGMSTVIAIELGKGKTELVSRLFTQNLLVSVLVSFVISAMTILNLETVARFLGATEDTLGYLWSSRVDLLYGVRRSDRVTVSFALQCYFWGKCDGP